MVTFDKNKYDIINDIPLSNIVNDYELVNNYYYDEKIMIYSNIIAFNFEYVQIVLYVKIVDTDNDKCIFCCTDIIPFKH
jgi:hypothetical protein